VKSHHGTVPACFGPGHCGRGVESAAFGFMLRRDEDRGLGLCSGPRLEILETPGGLEKNVCFFVIVTVKDGEVVAHGREFRKVYDQAKREAKRDFVTGFVLSGEPSVLNTAPEGCRP